MHKNNLTKELGSIVYLLCAAAVSFLSVHVFIVPSSFAPSGIEGYYATAALSGMKMTPAEYMAAVEAVTHDQVVAAANTVTYHSSFFLKGEDA